MKNLLFPLTLAILLISCIPDNVKETMASSLRQARQMLADQEFKKALGQIELHKLRNGNYPASLSELKFLSAMDSSIFTGVEYAKLDSGYELNLNMEFASIKGGKTEKIGLQYPPEFWNGLGCIKSNLK